jgi:hypothetical protein
LGADLNVGDSFTQDDINSGRVSYAPVAEAMSGTAFTFTVADTNGGVIGANDFTVTINVPDDGGNTGPQQQEPVTDPGLDFDPEPVPEPAAKPEPDPVAQRVPEPEEQMKEESRGLSGGTDTGEEPLVALSSNEDEEFTDPSQGAFTDTSDERERSRRQDGAPFPGAPPRPADLAADLELELLQQVEERLEVDDSAIPDALQRALDRMRTDLDRAAEEEQQLGATVATVGKLGGVSLSAGYLAWLLRAGPLLASALSTMPMWTKFDPLPVVMGGYDEKREKARQSSDADSEKVTQLLDASSSERPKEAS